MASSVLTYAFLALSISYTVAQQHYPNVEERVAILENKVSHLSSRILSLEYAYKDLQSGSQRPQSSHHNPIKIVQEVGQDPELPPAIVSPSHPVVDMGDFRPKDCSEIMEELHSTQRHSTFYTIYPISRNRPLEVFCDMETYGGGWTVVQRRGFEGVEREDFNRTWKQYAKGFGSLDADYWLGLDNLAALTKYDDQEVLYEFLSHRDGKKIVTYLNYEKFQVENADNFYRLHLAGFNDRYSTGLKYYLEKQDGMLFSTRDKDNAGTNNRNCRHHSGWWLQSVICHRQPDLNMPYDNGVLHLHKFSIVQDRDGVSIKVRAKKTVV